MSQQNESDLAPLSAEILRYLRAHPQAADTVDGIVRPAEQPDKFCQNFILLGLQVICSRCKRIHSRRSGVESVESVLCLRLLMDDLAMKSSLKSIVTGIVASSGLLLGAADANAVCIQLGAIEYSTTAGNGTTFYITAVDAVLPAFAYLYFAPTNTSFHETLSDAQAAGQIVRATGNAANCPAGVFRNAGTVIRVERFDQ